MTFIELFAQATFEYLESVRDNIGNNAFKGIFELDSSSALAVVLDTSGSMGDEIEAVKAQILEIIDVANAGGIVPSEYILAPYGGNFGTDVDPVITDDTDKVKEVLESLHATGGDEVTFKAFQVITLIPCPDHSLSNAPFRLFWLMPQLSLTSSRLLMNLVMTQSWLTQSLLLQKPNRAKLMSFGHWKSILLFHRPLTTLQCG